MDLKVIYSKKPNNQYFDKNKLNFSGEKKIYLIVGSSKHLLIISHRNSFPIILNFFIK